VEGIWSIAADIFGLPGLDLLYNTVGAFMAEPLIEMNPKIMMGKPVIAGTRITVELVLEKLAAGETIEQLLMSYPRLTEQSIRAALDFAAKSLGSAV
jgi:uncharacterized protein (DUF433 family)